MAITLTENAAKQIQSQLEKRGKGIALRIGVKNVGCSGLAHTFAIADEIRAGDHTFESHNAKVVVDANSLSFLDGSRIDFVKDRAQADVQIRQSQRRQRVRLWRELQHET